MIDKPVRGEQPAVGGIEGSPPLGRFDAATLLAVESANGGEWAGLAQVIVTFKVVFAQTPNVEEFTESCGLLCEAGLIEYVDEGLTLTPDGRKLLRRAGSSRSDSRPKNVADLLEIIDERDLAAEGSVPEPDLAEMTAAFDTLTADVTDDLERVQALNATRLAPPSMLIGNLRRGADYQPPFVPIDDMNSANDPSEEP